MLLIQAQPHECVRRGRKPLHPFASFAKYRDALRSWIDQVGRHTEQLRGAGTGADVEREQGAVTISTRYREQRIEEPVWQRARNPPVRPTGTRRSGAAAGPCQPESPSWTLTVFRAGLPEPTGEPMTLPSTRQRPWTAGKAAMSPASRLVPVLSLIHISEPTRRTPISYAVFCLKK